MNWTLVAVIAILLFFSIIGLKTGIVEMVWNLAFSVVGTALSVILTIYIGKMTGDKFSGITYVIVFIILTVVASIIGVFLNRVAKLPVVRVANDFGGLVVGFCQGFIVISIAMFVIKMLKDYSAVQWIVEDIDSNKFLLFLYDQNVWLFLAKKIF